MSNGDLWPELTPERIAANRKPTSGIALMFPSLNAIEVKLLKQMISEIIGEDDTRPIIQTYEGKSVTADFTRNNLRAEQRIRAGL